MPKSRHAIQSDFTSNDATSTELPLEDLERVRGGWSVLPTRPPEGSPYRSQWDQGFENLRDGSATAAGGLVTISRAEQTSDGFHQTLQRGSGFVQVMAGADRAIHGYSEMGTAAERQLQDQRAQAAAAAEAELEGQQLEKEQQDAEEAEDNRLLEQADRMLREDGAAPAQGSGGAPPANADPYYGEFPSFPAQLVNAPGGDAGVSIEPFGDATVGGSGDAGGGYGPATPGRLY